MMAQNIRGTLLQPDKTPAQYATVTIRSAKDSTVVKGTLSDEQGAFSFKNVANGNYFVQAELIGTGKKTSPVFQ